MNVKQFLDNPFIAKYKQFLIPFAALLIGIVLIALIIIPQILSSLKTQSDISASAGKFESLDKKIETLRGVDENTYQANVNLTQVAYPYDKEIPSLISQLLFLLNNSNLSVKNIGVATSTVSENGATGYNVNAEAEGTVSDIKNFVNRVKDAPRIMKIVGLEYTEASAGVAQVSFNIVTYFQPLATQLGSVDDAVEPLSESELELLKTLSANSNKIPVVTSVNVTGPRGKADPFE